MKEIINKLIIQARSNGWTNQDIANRFDLSKTQVSYILNGHCKMTPNQIDILCELAGCELMIKLK